jgi:hypothetical protein
LRRTQDQLDNLDPQPTNEPGNNTVLITTRGISIVDLTIPLVNQRALIVEELEELSAIVPAPPPQSGKKLV